MSVLAFLLAGLAYEVVKWIITSGANRFVTFSILIAVLGALLVSFTAVVHGAINLLVYSMPDHFATGMSLVVPSNLGKCVSAIVVVRLALFTYQHYKAVMLTSIGSSEGSG